MSILIRKDVDHRSGYGGLWAPTGGFQASPQTDITAFPFNYSMNTALKAIDNIWQTGNSYYSWEETGAFDGTPSMKMWPPSDTGWTSAFGAFNIGTNLPNTYLLSTRVMIRVGSSHIANTKDNKLIIMSPALKGTGNVQSPRAMMLENNNGDTDVTCYGACSGTVCKYNTEKSEAEWYYMSNTTDEPVNMQNEANNWICVELVADLENGTLKSYYTTEDNSVNVSIHNPYADFPTGSSGWVTGRHTLEEWFEVQKIGGYFNEVAPDEAYDANGYIELSHISISNAYQGPPAGFP